MANVSPKQSFELPYAEDIYDLESNDLKTLLQRLHGTLQNNSEQQVEGAAESTQKQAWNKKAQKLFDLAQQELQERQAVEDLNFVCEQNENNFFAKLEQDYSQRLVQNLKLWEGAQAQLTRSNVQEDTMQFDLELKKTHQSSGDNSQSRFDTDSQTSYKTRQTASRTAKDETQKHQRFLDGSEVSQQDSDHVSLRGRSQNSHSFTLDISKSSKSPSQNKNKHKKRDAMADFIKKTLQETKITDAQFIIGKSTGGKYIPPEQQSKRKDAPMGSVKGNASKDGNDYKNIKSRVRQELENAEASKQPIPYYTSGKPAFPRRKAAQLQRQLSLDQEAVEQKNEKKSSKLGLQKSRDRKSLQVEMTGKISTVLKKESRSEEAPAVVQEMKTQEAETLADKNQQASSEIQVQQKQQEQQKDQDIEEVIEMLNPSLSQKNLHQTSETLNELCNSISQKSLIAENNNNNNNNSQHSTATIQQSPSQKSLQGAVAQRIADDEMRELEMRLSIHSLAITELKEDREQAATQLTEEQAKKREQVIEDLRNEQQYQAEKLERKKSLQDLSKDNTNSRLGLGQALISYQEKLNEAIEEEIEEHDDSFLMRTEGTAVAVGTALKKKIVFRNDSQKQQKRQQKGTLQPSEQADTQQQESAQSAALAQKNTAETGSSKEKSQKILKNVELNLQLQEDIENAEFDSPTLVAQRNALRSMLQFISDESVRQEMRQKLRDILRARAQGKRLQEEIQAQEIVRQQLLQDLNPKTQTQTQTQPQAESVSLDSVEKTEPQQPPSQVPQQKTIIQKAPQSFEQQLNAKMRRALQNKTLVDYSPLYTTFESIFTGLACAGSASLQQVNALELMKEVQALFASHNSKTAGAASMQSEAVAAATAAFAKHQLVTPFDVRGSESYYVNDPKQVIVYADRVNIDLKLFVQRQIAQTRRLQGLRPTVATNINTQLFYRVVKSKQEVYDIITRSFLRKAQWEELPTGKNLRQSWNVLWTWSKPHVEWQRLLVWQRVNHFPQNKNLVRKDLLRQNVYAAVKSGGTAARVFDIIPQTFVLPKDFGAFTEAFARAAQTEGIYNYWIVKPVGKSQGRGISVVNDVSQVLSSDALIVQKYLKNPLLIDGRKFDMRIYVLVTSVNPLEAFVFREGFARLTTEEFSIHPDDIKNTQIHLTNFAIQRNFYDPAATDNFIGGTKITLRMLQDRLRTLGVQWEPLWMQVREIIVKSLLACQTQMPHAPNSFEVFGYDIIIDKTLRCWLLEVNSSPSLAREFIIDDLVKQHLIDDAIDLVAPPSFDRERLVEVLERRIRELSSDSNATSQGKNNTAPKKTPKTVEDNKDQLNLDLNYIMHSRRLRHYGETPENLGDFEMLAPGPLYDKLSKLLNGGKARRTVTQLFDGKLGGVDDF